MDTQIRQKMDQYAISVLKPKILDVSSALSHDVMEVYKNSSPSSMINNPMVKASPTKSKDMRSSSDIGIHTTQHENMGLGHKNTRYSVDYENVVRQGTVGGYDGIWWYR